MHKTASPRRWGVVIALASLTITASLAIAQTTAAPPAAENQTVNPGGEGKAGVAAGTVLVSPGQGGVAGTGLGKMPAGDPTGKGMSVQGPAGQAVGSDAPATTP